METLQTLLFIAQFVGLGIVIGPFLAGLRKKTGYPFTVMLVGAALHLMSVVGLWFVDANANPVAYVFKLVVALGIVVATLVGFLRQRAIRAEREKLRAGGAAVIAEVSIEPELTRFFFAAGVLALLNLALALILR